MKQYSLTGNKLHLKVKKTPFLVRIFLISLTSFIFLMPFISAILIISSDSEFKLGNFLLFIFCGLVGFYFLRLTLWNIYGREIIIFKENKFSYNTDYKWFKGKMQHLEINEPLEFGINPIGYEEDFKGALEISSGELFFHCVTKMPEAELKELIIELEFLK